MLRTGDCGAIVHASLAFQAVFEDFVRYEPAKSSEAFFVFSAGAILNSVLGLQCIWDDHITKGI
jgi:hypothetical protein